MKTSTLVSVPSGLSLLLLTLALGACNPHGPSTPDAGGPQALVEEWVEMWNSYDLDQVGRLFLNDDRLTYFSSEREGVIRGMDALLEHHRGFGFVPGGKDQPNRLWVEGLRADLLGDAAVLTGIWYFQSVPGETADPETGADEAPGGAGGTSGAGSGGEPLPQRGPVTFVCVRDGDTWRFVHMTFSEYLPPDPL